MNKILDNDYYDIIISNISVPTFDTGDNITFLTDRNSLVHMLRNEFNPCYLGRQPYNAFPALYTPESTISIEKSGIGQVQRNPFLNLYGHGILVGVVDTGINYLHQAFRNNDGTTRIISIWDQSIQTGTMPKGFSFGSEYTKDDINQAFHSEHPLSLVPTEDLNGHGTAIASIIAGKQAGDVAFSGIVTESELVVVKLKEAKKSLKEILFVEEDSYCFQESDILLGVRYLQAVSQEVRRPIVICIALGSNQGGHDGRSVLSSYLSYAVQLPGIGICVSAGNEGNKRRHYFNYTATSPYYHDFELRVGENEPLLWMEIWPYAPERISIDISSPNRESTQRVFPTINECRTFNFIFSESDIWINNIVLEEETGDQLILIRWKDPSPGVWYFRAQSVNDEPFSFHCWLPGGDLISNETFFINPNPDTTITSPGNGANQLTVTAYNQLTDSILGESSRGYTRNGIVKPDIAAPGFEIPCALFGENGYGTVTGTGAACAHAAGIVAMVMEWAIPKGNYSSMTGNDVNRLIIRGARRSTTIIYPNHVWGYGQIDINNLFQSLTNI